MPQNNVKDSKCPRIKENQVWLDGFLVHHV